MLQTLLAELCSEVSDLNFRLLKMRFVEDRAVPEVAAALNLTPEQVRVRQHRLLKKLRAMQAVYTGEQFGNT